MTKTIEERFEAKVDRSGDCHLWTAARDRHGYGEFWGGERYPSNNGPKNVGAHRWAYEHFVGPIPEGLHVLHRCDNPPCVNPAHLFLGTNADNVDDRDSKGRVWSKITEDDVRQIRRRYSEGELQRVIAADYGISQVSVSNIVRRVTWPHTNEEHEQENP